MILPCDVRLVATNPSYSALPHLETQWTEHEFNIVVLTEDGNEIVAGQMLVHKLNVGAVWRNKQPLFLAFDDYSQEAYECYVKVFDKEGDMRKPFQDESYGQYEFLANDFHLLSWMEIDEAFKGNWLAGIVAQIYFENFANGNDVVYSEVFPLQFSGALEEPYSRKFDGNFEECEMRLCAYFKKLGFRQINRSSDFFFVVDDFLDKWKKVKAELAIDD